MTGIRTTAFGVAVLGVGLLGACASPTAKTSAPVAPSAPPPAVATHVTASAPAAPAAPAVQAVSVVQVAPVSTPPVPPAAKTTVAAPPVASTPPSASTPPPAATTARTPSLPRPSAVPVATGSTPHFDTPDAAMRYLVAAYNAHDLKSEMHVTTPDSRTALENERQWVNTFSFHSCTVNPGGGDYSCQFDMVSKVKTTDDTIDAFGDDVQKMGEITVLVAPAERPGWYMYYNEGCGG